jgi:hypothetical protein
MRKTEDVVERAWREYLVTKQERRSHGERYIELAPEVEGWFRARELGLAWDERPSVFHIQANLDAINAENAGVMESARAEVLARAKERKRRRTADERRKHLRELQRAGMAKRRKTAVAA